MKRVILLTGFVLSCLSARGLQIIPLPIETLSSNATLIVHGTVTAKSVQRDAAGRIYTALDVQVQDVWKGQMRTNHLTIVHGGGVLGDEVSEVSGQAEYEVGEEIVSFLILNDRGEAVSIGLAQGKFHVWNDERTGEKMARNAIHGLRPGAGAANAAEVPARNGIVRRLTVQELRRRAMGARQ